MGAKVFALSRTESDLVSLEEACPGLRRITADLFDWEETKKAVETLTGDQVMDILINNAGIGGVQSFLQITPDKFDEYVLICPNFLHNFYII